MVSTANIHCVNFELEFIDHSNQAYISNKIFEFLDDTPPFLIKSVSVSLTKEDRYMVVAVVEYI